MGYTREQAEEIWQSHVFGIDKDELIRGFKNWLTADELIEFIEEYLGIDLAEDEDEEDEEGEEDEDRSESSVFVTEDQSVYRHSRLVCHGCIEPVGAKHEEWCQYAADEED